jgi:hypothetical protein
VKWPFVACVIALAGCPDRKSKRGPEWEWSIDVMACIEGRRHHGLPLGHMWVEAKPVGTTCEVLLGGETEDPRYGGWPTQKCVFERKPERIEISGRNQSGGPARIFDSRCVTLDPPPLDDPRRRGM